MKTEFGKDIYKCKKTETDSDIPDGKGSWTCTKGGEFNGTKCVEGAPPPPPKVGQLCKINEQAWCDGHTFCGWGKVNCDPKTGTWKTIVKNGKKVLDCWEVANLRPNTVCACYHTFFNPKCCERPDCIIPPGTKGQVCPASPGKLCDYCNPLNTFGCKDAGAKCVIDYSSGETYCGSACAANKPCPAGYICGNFKLQGVTSKQCIPTDNSCYF
jgi:hypothetical protein